jgi:peptidoglycan/LPS O-acetylase OafA/YrhL
MNKHIERQYALDIFRILAILGVAFFHYTFRGFAADNYSTLSFPILGKIFRYGYLGIYWFFMISGYTMFITAPNKGLKDFIISRMVRLYPVYWVAVTITSLVTLLVGADRFHVTFIQYLANLTMLNQLIGIDFVDGAWWFMVVILKFNFIIAIIILIRVIKYQEYIGAIWLIVAFVTLLLNIPILRSILIPEYAPFIIAGIIFQSAKVKGWNASKYIIISCSLIFSIYLIVLSTSDMQQHYNSSFSVVITSGIILFFFLAFYLITRKKQLINGPQSLLIYGSATYPLYLIHQNIGYMIFNLLGESFNRYTLLIATVFSMILISVIIAKYVEPCIYARLRKGIEIIESFVEQIFNRKKLI